MTRRIEETVVDGIVVERHFMSLRKELTLDFAEDFRRFVNEALGGVVPTDIDDFRARFNPETPFVNFLLANGVTQQQINNLPLATRLAFRLFARIALMAIIFDHGKIPSVANEIMDREDPVP